MSAAACPQWGEDGAHGTSDSSPDCMLMVPVRQPTPSVTTPIQNGTVKQSVILISHHSLRTPVFSQAFCFMIVQHIPNPTTNHPECTGLGSLSLSKELLGLNWQFNQYDTVNIVLYSSVLGVVYFI